MICSTLQQVGSVSSHPFQKQYCSVVLIEVPAASLFLFVLLTLLAAAVNTAGLDFCGHLVEVIGVMNYFIQDLLFDYFVEFVLVHDVTCKKRDCLWLSSTGVSKLA